jgi:hypothetical protein
VPISKKNLTYVNLLYVIGKSEKPLSSGEIEDQTKLSKYVFEMLEKIAPIGRRNRDESIFVIEEILSEDLKTKHKSIENLDKKLKLEWNITAEDIETKSVTISTRNKEKSLGSNIIKITYGNSKKIEIFTKNSIEDLTENKNIEDKQPAQIVISDGNNIKRRENLFIEKNQQKKPTVYTIKKIDNPIYYLDITFDDETQKIISSLETTKMPFFSSYNTGEIIKGIKQEDWKIAKEIEVIENIEKIKSDRSKWRYSLNIRGFLLYLNRVNHKNIIKLLDSEKHNNRIRKNSSNSQSHNDISRIRQVLSNPAIKNKFIFLNSWEKFDKKGVKVIEILLDIAKEFENQLEFDKRYLLVRITERYLFEIGKHFKEYGSFSHPYLSLSQETENMLNQYRLRVLEFLEKELILYTKNISNQIRYIKSGIDE